MAAPPRVAFHAGLDGAFRLDASSPRSHVANEAPEGKRPRGERQEQPAHRQSRSRWSLRRGLVWLSHVSSRVLVPEPHTWEV